MAKLCFSFSVVNNMGAKVTHFWLFDEDLPFRTRSGATSGSAARSPEFRLYKGPYTLTTWIADRRGDHVCEDLTEICPFEVDMGTWRREEYDWHDGLCVYLDDVEWRPVVQIAEA